MTIAEFRERRLQLITTCQEKNIANKKRFEQNNLAIRKHFKLGMDILECERLLQELPIRSADNE